MFPEPATACRQDLRPPSGRISGFPRCHTAFLMEFRQSLQRGFHPSLRMENTWQSRGFQRRHGGYRRKLLRNTVKLEFIAWKWVQMENFLSSWRLRLEVLRWKMKMQLKQAWGSRSKQKLDPTCLSHVVGIPKSSWNILKTLTSCY